ncbi:MAG: hypothetical protein JNM60_04020 [Candidatus Competibacteraceae bacterium]|nr:hypothetical protein [Candidatus Competibacteraceae bacterium]
MADAPALVRTEAPEAFSVKPPDGAPAMPPRPSVPPVQAELIRWLKRLGLYFGAVLAACAAGLFFLWQIPLLQDLPQFLDNLSDAVVTRPPPNPKAPALANNEQLGPITPVAPDQAPPPATGAPVAAQTATVSQLPTQAPATIPTPATAPAAAAAPAQTPAVAPAQVPATAAVQLQLPPPAQTPGAAPPQPQAQAPATTPAQPQLSAQAQAEAANPPPVAPGTITVNRSVPGPEAGAPVAADAAVPVPPGQQAAPVPGQADPAALPGAPVAPPALTPTAQQEIQQLLESARAQMENRRLTSPSSGNALSSYQRVLELEPNNPTAAEGIQRIATYYQDIARQSLQQGRTDEGLAYINRGLRAAPKSEVLLNLRRQVRQAKQREDERRQALLAERQRLEAEQQALQQPTARPRFQDIPPFQGGSQPIQSGSPQYQGAPPQGWRPRLAPPPQQSPRSGETGFNQR